jgi:hypothetical protein
MNDLANFVLEISAQLLPIRLTHFHSSLTP